jgi:plastocyanin
MTGRRLGIVGMALVAAGVVLLGAAGVLATNPVAMPGWVPGSATTNSLGMMGGGGVGMMRGDWSGASGPGPGEAGFVAGTPSAPRVVRIFATAYLRFTPDTVRVQSGETVRFDVTAMGPVTHEFMIGPAADVAADTAGTPELANISMMQTASLTYTFSGSGPFAFACHAPGHYEAGMSGTIVVVN